MASERDRLEALYTFARAQELADRPVEGSFDAEHLREVNRRLFQDMPRLGYSDVTPGEYRSPVAEGRDWYKNRSLEGREENSIVAYSRMDEHAQRDLDDTLTAADPGRLSRLDTADFTKAVADLYTRLDYLHPFPDGNSRTLRAFTSQLANESGFNLDWSRFNESDGGRNVLYVARDLSVNRLALDRVTGDDTRIGIMFTLDQFEGNRDLNDLLQDAVRPHRAMAFSNLEEPDAVAAFPELAPAYSALRSATKQSMETMPDSAEKRQQFQAAVHGKIQARLDAGRLIQYKSHAASARHNTTIDKDQER